jgi:hypothetical protein
VNAEFDLLVSQAVSHARLLERALHDPGPWWAVTYGGETECRVPVSRTVLAAERRVVLTAYLARGCERISAVEIYCAGELVTARGITGEPSAPCRISLGVGIGAPEPAW